MTLIKIDQILGIGNADGKPFVEIRLHTGAAHKMVFDPALTPELIVLQRRHRLCAARLRQADKKLTSPTSIWR
jgi:hypothetical protein